ncbi:hypothetical protein Pelo_15619 [Pelomyxa schiedti]|nr:hypothetical protein Pelo_15619 [Pelomyxa schiedti]
MESLRGQYGPPVSFLETLVDSSTSKQFISTSKKKERVPSFLLIANTESNAKYSRIPVEQRVMLITLSVPLRCVPSTSTTTSVGVSSLGLYTLSNTSSGLDGINFKSPTEKMLSTREWGREAVTFSLLSRSRRSAPAPDHKPLPIGHITHPHYPHWVLANQPDPAVNFSFPFPFRFGFGFPSATIAQAPPRPRPPTAAFAHICHELGVADPVAPRRRRHPPCPPALHASDDAPEQPRHPHPQKRHAELLAGARLSRPCRLPVRGVSARRGGQAARWRLIMLAARAQHERSGGVVDKLPQQAGDDVAAYGWEQGPQLVVATQN